MFANPTVNLSATLQHVCEDRVLLVSVDFTCPDAGSNIQNASEQFVWCTHISFETSPFIQPPQTII